MLLASVQSNIGSGSQGPPPGSKIPRDSGEKGRVGDGKRRRLRSSLVDKMQDRRTIKGPVMKRRVAGEGENSTPPLFETNQKACSRAKQSELANAREKSGKAAEKGGTANQLRGELNAPSLSQQQPHFNLLSGLGGKTEKLEEKEVSMFKGQRKNSLKGGRGTMVVDYTNAIS